MFISESVCVSCNRTVNLCTRVCETEIVLSLISCYYVIIIVLALHYNLDNL